MPTRLMQMLMRDEGSVKDMQGNHIPYQCPADKLTIGYGRNIEERGITEDEALYLLNNDIALCKAEIVKNLPIYARLDDARQTVLVNMCFNLGMPTLLTFKRFITALSAGDYESAAREMLDSKWARQVGARAIRLADMMRSGQWQ